MNRGGVGEDWGSKETDGCPLTQSSIVLKTYIRRLFSPYAHKYYPLPYIGRVQVSNQ
jgi:hypothetical protein